MDTLDVNVYGSMNVCMAARETGVEHVLGISTDKACHAYNLYGSTKYVMEKVFQEYARAEDGQTQFHLVRYGNVIESNGSVVQAWKRAVDNGEPVKITDPEMTRFWLSPSQAVEYVIQSLELKSGLIYIPKMPALSIGKLLEYSIGDRHHEVEQVQLRPGEKLHETLLTSEETHYALDCEDFFILYPTTSARNDAVNGMHSYTSDTARELTEGELQELLADV
jgi:UDP-N-acetylglucosamine 4,6-dehydratase